MESGIRLFGKCWFRFGLRIYVGFGLLVFVLGFSSGICYGQTAAEFLRQKKTQEKYLLQQLAYLKLYAGQVKEGYYIAASGLNTIKGFTSGEFSLHEAFFGSLSLVKPFIRLDYRVAEIAAMQVQIGYVFSAMLASKLNVAALEYVRLVDRSLRLECEKDLDELLLVVSSSGLELSDEQRLAGLAKVYGSMQQKMEFSYALYAEVKVLERAMKKEQGSIDGLRRLYEKD